MLQMSSVLDTEDYCSFTNLAAALAAVICFETCERVQYWYEIVTKMSELLLAQFCLESHLMGLTLIKNVLKKHCH